MVAASIASRLRVGECTSSARPRRASPYPSARSVATPALRGFGRESNTSSPPWSRWAGNGCGYRPGSSDLPTHGEGSGLQPTSPVQSQGMRCGRFLTPKGDPGTTGMVISARMNPSGRGTNQRYCEATPQAPCFAHFAGFMSGFSRCPQRHEIWCRPRLGYNSGIPGAAGEIAYRGREPARAIH